MLRTSPVCKALCAHPIHVQTLKLEQYEAEKAAKLEQAKAAISLIENDPSSNWRVNAKMNERYGEPEATAYLRSIKPATPLNYPYEDLKATLSVGCDPGFYVKTYIIFNKPANLGSISYDEDGDRYQYVELKFDDKVVSGKLFHRNGHRAVHVYVEPNPWTAKRFDMPAMLSKHSKLSMYISWYGGGSYFDFPLEGAARAMEQMQSVCNPKLEQS